MSKKITAKKFTANVMISIGVQIISLAVSFILNLIVPKFIDEYQYSYWQTYILYVSYVGVLHFGLLDGLVLRFSQYDYDEIDKRTIRSQFKILIIFTSIIAIITIISALIFTHNQAKYIVIFVAIGIITKNIHTYNSYTFQITNRISKYAIITIVQRLTYGLFATILLIFKINDFRLYCIADIIGDLIAICLSFFFNKGMYFGESLAIRETILELKQNVSAGIILMLANFSAMLIIGGAKMIVQWHWDELVFGKVSFSFSLSNVFATFVTAISVVLFPSLKRLDSDKLPSLYKNIRSTISLFLFGIMCAYFPGCWILNMWLPKYAESLTYLGYLLPIIIFSSKVSLLTNNYLKVYRKEKYMMIVNLCSVIGGLILFSLCAFVFNNLIALLLCIVLTIMLNSIASESVVLKVINIKLLKEFIIEALMVVAFICSTTYLSLGWGLIAYFGAFIIYSIINYKTYVSIFKKLLKKKETIAKEENV